MLGRLIFSSHGKSDDRNAECGDEEQRKRYGESFVQLSFSLVYVHFQNSFLPFGAENRLSIFSPENSSLYSFCKKTRNCTPKRAKISPDMPRFAHFPYRDEAYFPNRQCRRFFLGHMSIAMKYIITEKPTAAIRRSQRHISQSISAPMCSFLLPVPKSAR